jgi:hypothetical protein
MTAKTAAPKLPLNMSVYFKARGAAGKANEDFAHFTKSVAAKVEAAAKFDCIVKAIEAGKQKGDGALNVLLAETARIHESTLRGSVVRAREAYQAAVRVVEEEGAKIEAVLKDANGKARRHTFTTAKEIAAIVCGAVESLDVAGVTLKQRAGTIIEATSGGKLPNSYKNSRLVTRVEIRFGSNGKAVFLDSVAAERGHTDAGRVKIALTEAGKTDWLRVKGNSSDTLKAA